MSNTSALRVVEEIDDPLEVATREVRQVESEKAEVVAKLEELRGKLAEVEAIVSSGDHRKINDDLLDRGEKCRRAIAALEKALEIVEARRIEASERDSAIRRHRAAAAVEAETPDCQKRIDESTAALEAAVHALGKAIMQRNDVLAAAERHNAAARSWGVTTGATWMSTGELLARLAKETGLHIGNVGASAAFIRT
jgi:chromosome segregation ATPase